MVTNKANRTTISVLRTTKGALDSMKRPGQSYDGIIQELVKFGRIKVASTGPGEREQTLNSRISARRERDNR